MQDGHIILHVLKNDGSSVTVHHPFFRIVNKHQFLDNYN